MRPSPANITEPAIPRIQGLANLLNFRSIPRLNYYRKVSEDYSKAACFSPKRFPRRQHRSSAVSLPRISRITRKRDKHNSWNSWQVFLLYTLPHEINVLQRSTCSIRDAKTRPAT